MSESSPVQTMPLDDLQVAQYLSQERNFFSRYPELVEQLSLPHGPQGTVSLVELQVKRLRQRIAQLEEEITELMEVAAHNEALFKVYGSLYSELIGCDSLARLSQVLERELRSRAGISAISLRLSAARFALPSRYQGYAINGEQLHQLRLSRLAGGSHYFGRINQQEKSWLFGDDPLVNSCALMTLGEGEDYGLLAIASADAGHYAPGMDNLLLGQLCRMIALLLPKLVPLK